MTPRSVLVRLHRWSGLGLAGFLALVGLTGAAIAWNDAGERLFAPTMFVLSPERASRPPLDPFALRDAAERAAPAYAVNVLDFTRRTDEPARFSLQARPNGPVPYNDEIALDPATGDLIAARRSGDLRQGSINIMPFVYDLHDSLAMGDGGAFVLGCVALAWTLDCMVGFWLTLPVRARHPRKPASWMRRWARMWRIRWPTTTFKISFDLHTAVGLWLWPMLFILAWSGVAFNLPRVYRPVMTALFGWDTPESGSMSVGSDAPDNRAPTLDFRQAYAIARQAMAQEAVRLHFKTVSERLMIYDPDTRTYGYRVLTNLDPGRQGNTQITIGADDGRVIALRRPTGGATGTTLTTWLEDIHTASVGGWPMRGALTMVGIGIASLSVTGILIWQRKARSRAHAS